MRKIVRELRNGKAMRDGIPSKVRCKNGGGD